MTDINSREDIVLLVNSFYEKVRGDELIGPVFEERIKDDWEPHLQKMYGFWENILFGNNAYSGRPFPPHATLGIDVPHFERWIALFHETLNELFEGKRAEEAKKRAVLIGRVFLEKLEMMGRVGRE
ncbi:MAG: group III truncated hemoglobin [Flavobacteriia bacterium]|nr:group III truncated hemoglobin [Flavobacteriia bacterium]